VKDFQLKQQINAENMDKMRSSFEDVIAKLDKQIQDNEKEYDRRLAPWKDQVDQKDRKIQHLEEMIDEFKTLEAETREREKSAMEELENLLFSAKKSEEISRQAAYKAQRELQAHIEQLEGANDPRKQVLRLKMQLEQVTAQCETMIKFKDIEVKEKAEMINKLQRRVLEQAEKESNTKCLRRYFD
jgi:DNA repair exonuclease SbcCD ATPase subunit